MGWCRVAECPNIVLVGGLCPKHRLEETNKRSHQRKRKRKTKSKEIRGESRR